MTHKELNIFTVPAYIALAALLLLSGCVDFFNPVQELDVREENLFDDWYEYRSAEMGLYALQQDLAEQIIVLGELRADLMTVTENADADLLEIYNFDVSDDNKYASPTGFFKLIAASNKFLNILKWEHPEVLDPDEEVTNYDRLYGEALCMRAWAYFNAVRIYGRVPFLPESLEDIDEIEAFLNTSETYIDSVDIVFSQDGYYNDTIYNNPIELEKKYYDQSLIIDYFTNDLENNIKAVGVNHAIDNNDDTWEVTIWNRHAMHTLLGQMYLTEGNLAQAVFHFEKITDYISDNYRYQLDGTFRNQNWRNIFNTIDSREHIYTLWFNKGSLQQNDFQNLFDSRPPYQYMLKPTLKAVSNWETIWDKFELVINNSQPSLTKLSTSKPGVPGDYHRGHGVSYAYVLNGEPLEKEEIIEMLTLRKQEDFQSANLVTENTDTVVYKYSWNKDIFDEDANLLLYRASGVHLWLAEAYVWWAFERGGGVSTFTTYAIDIVNNGAQYGSAGSREQLGVRGRVGFGEFYEGINVGNINYFRDPYTNEVLGFIDLSGDKYGKQKYLEDQIIEEKARELAFEGERYYDLMRVAKRRNDPAFLASRVSEKYPPELRDQIYNLLLDENNWYINLFD